MVAKVQLENHEFTESNHKFTDYVENIESDVAEIKFFLSQIYKTITIYKEKKENFKEVVEKLNETIAAYQEKEKIYQQEIEMLNKTINTIREREMKYFEQIKALEKKLTERIEKEVQPHNNVSKNEGGSKPKNKNTRTQLPQKSTGSVHNLPDNYYEKRPHYNDIIVSKVIDPFKNFRGV